MCGLLGTLQTWGASPCASTLGEKEKSFIEQCLSRTSVITRFGLVPLRSFLDALATTLHQHGYAMESLRRALRAGDQCGRGCPSRTRPLPRCMGRSSNALAARCHALLRADGPKPRRASPLCCGSGASTTSFHPAPVPQRTRKWTRRCQLHAKIAPTGIILDYGDGSTCHYPRSLTSLGLCTGQSHGMHPRHVP